MAAGMEMKNQEWEQEGEGEKMPPHCPLTGAFTMFTLGLEDTFRSRSHLSILISHLLKSGGLPRANQRPGAHSWKSIAYKQNGIDGDGSQRISAPLQNGCLQIHFGKPRLKATVLTI